MDLNLDEIVDLVLPHLSVVVVLVVEKETISMKIADQLMRQVEREREAQVVRPSQSHQTLPCQQQLWETLCCQVKRRRKRRTQETDDLDINVYDDLIFF